MITFAKRFQTVLEQDEQIPAEQESPDAAAMANTLEPGTDPAALGADVDAQASNAINSREQKQVEQLTIWVKQLEDFMQYLNGVEPGSIQSVLKGAIPDTLLDKVRSTETKKIARTATDLATLIETFKGYLATSRDPKYRFQ